MSSTWQKPLRSIRRLLPSRRSRNRLELRLPRPSGVALVAGVRTSTATSATPRGGGRRSSGVVRDRREGSKRRMDLSGFCHVLDIDTAGGWVDVEGLTTYEELVAQTLPHGVMPAVVPQLKTITVGGAAAGVGIEATSFHCGLVHDTLL